MYSAAPRANLSLTGVTTQISITFDSVHISACSIRRSLHSFVIVLCQCKLGAMDEEQLYAAWRSLTPPSDEQLAAALLKWNEEVVRVVTTFWPPSRVPAALAALPPLDRCLLVEGDDGLESVSDKPETLRLFVRTIHLVELEKAAGKPN
jgi:hypothetical protein